MRRILLVIVVCLTGGLIYLIESKEEVRQTQQKTNNKELTPSEMRAEELRKKREKRLKGYSKSDSPDEFFLFHRSIRTRDGEEGPGYQANYRLEELNKALQNQARARGFRRATLDWKERGPGNVAGRTRSLLVLPGDASKNTWLAGAVGGGIWKTTDGGQTWVNKSSDFPSLSITTLAMSDTDPAIIYAGTGEHIASAGTAIIGDGIFKSDDAGETWTQLASTAKNPNFRSVNRIVIDPQKPDTLVVCASENTWDASDRSVILRSVDGGVTWDEVYESVNAISQIVTTPGNFNIQFAAVNGVGALKSTDGGVTWELSNSGMQVTGRVELAIAPTMPSRIYASAVGDLSGTGSDLYISDDAGENWNIITNTNGQQNEDFLGGQGWYDNTIAVDPYDEDIVYYGGVNLWRTSMADGTIVKNLPDVTTEENNTQSFFDTFDFGAPYLDGGLELGDSDEENFVSVEIRFGPGKSQMAYRFTVPDGSGAGVQASNYDYQDYVEVPFEVWDVVNNQQLMVSFRDQQKDGIFQLITRNTAAGNENNHSREYMFISSIPYSETPDENFTKNGGHEHEQLYFIWPILAQGATWNAQTLPGSNITINYGRIPIEQRVGALRNVSDAYQQFDKINTVFGNDDLYAFHPDQHYLVMVPMSESIKTYKILVGNDGGVFVSNTAIQPGINDGDWTFSGFGYNTSQFYGVDKQPGEDRYIGGTQDNGTWMSPANVSSSKTTNYDHVIGGDGFQVVWNFSDARKIIGGSQGNNFRRTTNGGITWTDATTGITGTSPFISKLANSKKNPEVLYTVTSNGVFKSEDFGGNWKLTPINSAWGASTFLNVKVSLSNPNIVWAGSGMSASRKLHVSTDWGDSFEATNNFSNLGLISGFATHPFEDSTAYALFSFAGGPKVVRTRNLGETWEELSGFGNNSTSANGFPDVAVYSLLVLPHEPNTLWAGTEIGIFESTDNGLNWSIADNGFPAASVWEMKVVDDQIVVATHGRGIWSVTMTEIPAVVPVPTINALGTSVLGELVVDASFFSDFDSVDVLVDNQLAKRVETVGTGEMIIRAANQPFDQALNVILRAYLDGQSQNSQPQQITLFEPNAPQLIYTEDFNEESSEDFIGNGFTVSSQVGFNDGAIHSEHNYADGNIEYVYQLKTPIIISETNLGGGDPSFTYDDVALIEPGEAGSVFGSDNFFDYVIVEGTKDGVNWIPLANGYDATFDDDWKEAYDNNQNGNSDLFVRHRINLLNRFTANQDTVFFRFRLFSDPFTTGYGWVIDNLYIQDRPTGVNNRLDINNDLEVFNYPNPTSGESIISYNIPALSKSVIQVIDAEGRLLKNIDIGQTRAGKGTYRLDVSQFSSGIYYIKLISDRNSKVTRMMIQ
ncbi:T9SS type A sorting domain-containing protein [Fulvivirgaceae bacterium BMA10]|uniref:T9SS type A sorting domain-containing protein n=1 Tax=Splendidivirga corallicola TaxID=3051826 RepID=A0ABT8KQ77_9BACT|nr:T9SS type A sorting domain-containing protein [Fulvivirgaceae bacterium BMA10]